LGSSGKSEARKHLTSPGKTSGSEAIEAAPGTTHGRGVYPLPAADEPACRFETQKNWIERARRKAAPPLNVRTGKLFGDVRKKTLQNTKCLQ